METNLLFKIIFGIASFLLVGMITSAYAWIHSQGKQIAANTICITRLEEQYKNIKEMLEKILDNQEKLEDKINGR